MKTFTLLLAFAVIIINSLDAQTASRLIGDTYYLNSTNKFVPQDSIVYYYTGSNGGDLNHPVKFTGSDYYYYNSAQYDSDYIMFQTFDVDDNIDTTTTQVWSSSSNMYVKAGQSIYYYDENNRDTTVLQKGWDSVANTWVNDDRLIYAYNTSGYLTLSANLLWKDTVWVPYDEQGYNYDSYNNLTFQANMSWNGTGWDTSQPWAIYNNYYNTKNEDSLILSIGVFDFYRQDSFVHVMDTGGRTFIIYKINSNIDSLQLTQSWNGIIWANAQKLIYNYDNNSNDTSIVTQHWYQSDSQWVNFNQQLFNYNNFNQLTKYKYWNWNDSGYWEVDEGAYEDFYYYETYATGINQLSVNNNQLSVYPNPANNSFYIAINLPQPSRLQLNLINILGQTVWSADEGNVSTFNGNISVADLPGGVYLLQMKTDGGVQTKEVVVAR